MIAVLEHIAGLLRSARVSSRTSQRALGARTGMTQAQISRIENALVDPRASTLMEMCRALDLELMLVPRERIALVRHLLESGDDTRRRTGYPRALYALDDEGPDDDDD